MWPPASSGAGPPRSDDNQTEHQSTGASFSVGVGVAWEPWDRVGLWVRQSLSLSVRNEQWNREDFDKSALALSYARPEVIAFFAF